MQPCFEGSLEDPLLRLGIVERRKVSHTLCVQAPVMGALGLALLALNVIWQT